MIARLMLFIVMFTGQGFLSLALSASAASAASAAAGDAEATRWWGLSQQCESFGDVEDARESFGDVEDAIAEAGAAAEAGAGHAEPPSDEESEDGIPDPLGLRDYGGDAMDERVDRALFQGLAGKPIAPSETVTLVELLLNQLGLQVRFEHHGDDRNRKKFAIIEEIERMTAESDIVGVAVAAASVQAMSLYETLNEAIRDIDMDAVHAEQDKISESSGTGSAGPAYQAPGVQVVPTYHAPGVQESKGKKAVKAANGGKGKKAVKAANGGKNMKKLREQLRELNPSPRRSSRESRLPGYFRDFKMGTLASSNGA